MPATGSHVWPVMKPRPNVSQVSREFAIEQDADQDQQSDSNT